ncbi:cyclic nucleotide-binding domain-containing protein [Streptomyces sp. 7R007]
MPLFASLPDPVLHTLWTASTPRRHGTAELLRLQGSPADHLLVLLDGRAATSATTAGGRVVRCARGRGRAPWTRSRCSTARATPRRTPRSRRVPYGLLPRARFLAPLGDPAAVRTHVLRLLAARARARQRRLTATATLLCEAPLAAWLPDT